MGHEKFIGIVNGYIKQLNPSYLDICSTVAPGITEQFGPKAVHSTTRGLHPNLISGLKTIVKHVGGRKAEVIAREYHKVGISCMTHRLSRTTEIAHILNNAAYGAALIFSDEMNKLCRAYGVDYHEAVMKYTETHNRGFIDLDHSRLVRSILMPPNGRIGGHCVTQGAMLIPEELRGPILDYLAHYEERQGQSRLRVKPEPVQDLRLVETDLHMDESRDSKGSEAVVPDNGGGVGPL